MWFQRDLVLQNPILLLFFQGLLLPEKINNNFIIQFKDQETVSSHVYIYN